MIKIKRMLFSMMATLGFALPLAMPVVVHAADNDIIEGFCTGVENEDVTDCAGGDTLNEQSLIATVINFLSLVVGVVAVIMIIVGGFKYITSGGDSGNVTGAKNTILYALIGIIIVVLAQVIIRFVIGQTAEVITP